MGRKRKQSEFEVWIGAAMLPWQVWVLLAAVNYLVLYHYVTAEIVSPATASPSAVLQLGANIKSQIFKTLAMFVEYLLPAICIIGAIISADRRRK